MASTYSGGVGKLQLMADGENSGIWGQVLNANFQVLEEMVSGHVSLSVAGSATVTLTGDTNVGSSYAGAQAKTALITLTGAVSGNHDLVAPAKEGWYIIQDTSTGNFDLTFKPSGGTGVVVPRGGKTFMFTDGSTMFNLLDEVNRLSEINDADNNEVLKFGTTASAVNELTVTNAATSNKPTLSATGGDTNVGIAITPKGSGEVTVSGTLNTAAISSSSTVTATSFAGSGSALTGVDPFPSGTKMMFNQTSAPTDWTKLTSENDKALRVVSGTVSSGGTHPLSTPPSISHTHTFTGGSNTTSSSGAHTHSHTLAGAAHTLTTSEIPAHSHTVAGGARNFSTQGTGGSGAGDGGGFTYYAATDNTGGGSSHSHTLSGSITSGGAHTHTLTPTGTTDATAPTAFAPQYVDVIIASKD